MLLVLLLVIEISSKIDKTIKPNKNKLVVDPYQYKVFFLHFID